METAGIHEVGINLSLCLSKDLCYYKRNVNTVPCTTSLGCRVGGRQQEHGLKAEWGMAGAGEQQWRDAQEGSSAPWGNPGLLLDTWSPPGLSSSLLQHKQIRSTSSWKLKTASRICTQTNSPTQQEMGIENLQPQVAWSNPR